MFNIVDFGAVGDGETLNTQAFAEAIDAAALQAGGVVHVPAGVWLTGTIFLADGITLDLHPAARILGSPRLEDYTKMDYGPHGDRTPWHLIVASGKKQVTIRGGTIDGNGIAFWEACRTGRLTPKDQEVQPGHFEGIEPVYVVPA